MSYKAKARAYFTAVNEYDVDAIERIVDENYIQHNIRVPTGRAAFLALLPLLKRAGSKIKNVRMLEDGRHVIMHHQWSNATPFGFEKMVAFHIIRFDSQTLIAEHWNAMMKDREQGGSLTDGATEIVDRHLTDKNKQAVADWFKDPRDFVTSDLTYRKQHKIFGEGNFTLSISEGSLSGVLSAIYDLFRLEKGRRVDHWQIIQEIPTKNVANENTMFGFR